MTRVWRQSWQVASVLLVFCWGSLEVLRGVLEDEDEQWGGKGGRANETFPLRTFCFGVCSPLPTMCHLILG